MNRLRIWIIMSILSLLTTGAMAQNRPNSVVQEPEVHAHLDMDEANRFSYYYLEAIRQENLGNYASAFELLRHCLEINPTSDATYFSLSTYYSSMKEDSLALLCLKQAVALNPSNNIYLESLGKHYINIDNYEKATEVFERLAEKSPTRTDILGLLNKLYQLDSNYDGMLWVVDRLERLDGPSEDLTLSRMHIYALQGKKKEELNVLKEMSRQHPNDYNYRVMMGNWFLQNDKKKKALAEFNYVLRNEPDNYMALSSLLDYYKTEGNDEQIKNISERILLSNNTEPLHKLIILGQLIEDNEKENKNNTFIISLFEKILDEPNPDPDFAEMYVSFLEHQKMPQDDINKAYERVLSLSPYNDDIRIKLLQSLWTTQEFDRIISLSEPALEYNTEALPYYYFMGMAYYQKGNIDKTLEIFKEGIKKINSNSNSLLASDFYEITGDLLHQKGLEDEAFEAYDSCLTWNPDNIGCLNNYAYYLSVRGERLPDAEQMSFRTVKAEPNNSTYLDTYAWILFMQERYEEAKLYIDQAIRNNTQNDDVITEHAGDIYMMCNNAEKAVEYWKKALEQGSENRKLIEKKIESRQYIAK